MSFSNPSQGEVEVWITLSPLSYPWPTILIVLVELLTPTALKVSIPTKTLLWRSLYFTLWVVANDGLTSISIKCPARIPWLTPVVTVTVLFVASPEMVS